MAWSIIRARRILFNSVLLISKPLAETDQALVVAYNGLALTRTGLDR
jgi:hypothetical protein